MTFSVIVPVCNGAATLEDSVQSALEQQSYFPGKRDFYEIIIVENGSSDDSPSIADRLAARNECVSVIHKGKIGLFRARQEGIRAAKGDWIVSLDADDRLAPGALKNLYEAIEGSDNSLDLILFNAATMEEGRKLRNYPFTPGIVAAGEDKKIYMEQLCRDDSVNAMWIKAVKRSIAAFDNIDLFLNYGEDLYQTAEYLDRAVGIMYLDEILYHYRKDSVSLSSTYSEIYLEDEKKTWEMLDEKAGKWFGDQFTETISRRKALTCTIAVTKLVNSGLSMAIKKHKLCKLLEDPFYEEYRGYPLPDWAPEESVYIRKLQEATRPRQALLRESLKHNIKTRIKGRLRNGK